MRSISEMSNQGEGVNEDSVILIFEARNINRTILETFYIGFVNNHPRNFQKG